MDHEHTNRYKPIRTPSVESEIIRRIAVALKIDNPSASITDLEAAILGEIARLQEECR